MNGAKLRWTVGAGACAALLAVSIAFAQQQPQKEQQPKDQASQKEDNQQHEQRQQTEGRKADQAPQGVWRQLAKTHRSIVEMEVARLRDSQRKTFADGQRPPGEQTPQGTNPQAEAKKSQNQQQRPQLGNRERRDQEEQNNQTENKNQAGQNQEGSQDRRRDNKDRTETKGPLETEQLWQELGQMHERLVQLKLEGAESAPPLQQRQGKQPPPTQTPNRQPPPPEADDAAGQQDNQQPQRGIDRQTQQLDRNAQRQPNPPPPQSRRLPPQRRGPAVDNPEIRQLERRMAVLYQRILEIDLAAATGKAHQVAKPPVKETEEKKSDSRNMLAV